MVALGNLKLVLGQLYMLTAKRCNTVVITWILNCVSKQIHASVLYKPTAYIIWKELQEKFSQSNGSQIFQLEKDISSLTQNQNPMSEYYTLFQGL